MEKRRWITNLHKVEIEICTTCNLRCCNCDRSARQAPSNEQMTLAQLERFVDESLQLNWLWERITILGGEPTLHPQFQRVLDILEKYRRHNPSTIFRIYSNGYGEKVQEILAHIPSWFEVINTNKTRQSPLFSAYNLAPIDFPEYANEDFTKGCAITHWCGLGLTRYGYYPCGAGASLDRVFGFDIGIKRLEDVTPKRLTDQLIRLCSLCGHYRDFDYRVAYVKSHDKNDLQGWTTEEKISPTWQAAYNQFRQQRPQLTLY